MRGALKNGHQLASVLPLCVLLAAMFISGCAGTPITAHPTEDFVDTDAAKALVGMPERQVTDRFGEPEWRLEFPDKTYLLYSAAGQVDLVWDLFMPFILLPAEAYSDDGLDTLYCAVFDINKAGEVTRFDSDWSRFYAVSHQGKLQTCMGLIPTNLLTAERGRLRQKVTTEGDAEAYITLKNIFKDSDHAMGLDTRKRAELLGNADAQLQLYYSTTGETRLNWICRAADNGNAFARYRIAVLYENGIESVERDYAKAQMWYRLAAISGHVWGDSNAERLAKKSTKAELNKVARMLKDWRVGTCEAEISGPLPKATSSK